MSGRAPTNSSNAGSFNATSNAKTSDNHACLPAGGGVERFLRSLETANWWGQIVGPHGTGKTTLLHTLDYQWSIHQREPFRISLHQGDKRLPNFKLRDLQPQTQVIVDGYEQLSRWSRVKLFAGCKRARCGLLITTHAATCLLTTIHQTHTSVDTLRLLVTRITNDSGSPPVPAEVVKECLAICRGNIRESFMMLYDYLERRSQPNSYHQSTSAKTNATVE